MIINDEQLNDLIKIKLPDNYELTDLLTIKMLKINFLFDYKELLKISNIEELRFNNIVIEEELLEVINALPKLKRLYFINCDIDSLEILEDKLEELYFERCIINDISVINKFTKLNNIGIVDMGEVDLNKISVIRYIKDINFMNSKIINEDDLIYLSNVINLCLANTGITNIDTLAENETLKILIIDDDIFNNNKDVVNHLINKNKIVTNMYGESFGDIND